MLSVLLFLSCIKIANKQDQIKQKQSFKREKEHVQRFILAYFKLLKAGKLAVSLRLQQSKKGSIAIFKLCFGFLY